MADPFVLPLGAVVLGWIIGGGSPGPATLMISGTSMAHGRRAGLQVAAGICIGSGIWGLAAGLGLSALMVANAWVMQSVKTVGALYLLWLAVKSLRAAWRGGAASPQRPKARNLFRTGLLLHLTNPKAILGWGSIYAITLAPDADQTAVWKLFGLLSTGSWCVFLGYALIFSNGRIARGYAQMRRGFDAAFGVLFGAAALKVLTLRVT